jgi:hypothetical protein
MGRLFQSGSGAEEGMVSDLLEKLARVEGYNEAHPKCDLLPRVYRSA